MAWWFSSITASDMKRSPASGMVTLTGPASRSKTAVEYSVSRLGRITVGISTGTRLRQWENLPSPPRATVKPK
ncbi:hypothetical protein FQZ97_825160 [compost metagenome]